MLASAMPMDAPGTPFEDRRSDPLGGLEVVRQVRDVKDVAPKAPVGTPVTVDVVHGGIVPKCIQVVTVPDEPKSSLLDGETLVLDGPQVILEGWTTVAVLIEDRRPFACCQAEAPILACWHHYLIDVDDAGVPVQADLEDIRVSERRNLVA